MTADRARVAVATVCSDGFELGTAVTLASFRAANPAFDGDMIVIAGDLGDAARRLIERSGPVAFVDPDAGLSRRIAELCDVRPDFTARRDRFLSLHAFALRGYRTVLFLDSDVVVTGDFGALLGRPEELLACPESATSRGMHRDRETFAPVARQAGGIACFNAGMMAIGGAMLQGEVFERLVDRVRPQTWHAVATGHTDQYLLNIALADRVRFAGSEYNLLLGHHVTGRVRSALAPRDVRMFHFNGPAKPWQVTRSGAPAADDELVDYALSRWREHARRVLRQGEAIAP